MYEKIHLIVIVLSIVCDRGSDLESLIVISLQCKGKLFLSVLRELGHEISGTETRA